MQCYICGGKVSMGLDFIPIEPPRKNRKWVCTKCATNEQKKTAKQNLGDVGLMISQLINSNFLKEVK